MTRIFATAACITALAMPMTASAQDVSAETQARLKAAESADTSNEQQIYINGRLVDAGGANVTIGEQGEMYIRMNPDWDTTPAMEDETGMAMSPSEIEDVCRSGDTLAKVGLPCG